MAPQGAYRSGIRTGDETSGKAEVHLGAASDALTLALLVLGEGRPDDGTSEKRARASQARAFLAEAVTALSRARIYQPGIHTHPLTVVMSTERDKNAELQRLYQLATRLLWQNHRHLPARVQATPLLPEEEAQLADVLRGLARSAKLRRYRFAIAGIVAAGLAPMIGLGGVGLALAIVGVGVSVLDAWRQGGEEGEGGGGVVAALPSSTSTGNCTTSML